MTGRAAASPRDAAGGPRQSRRRRLAPPAPRDRRTEPCGAGAPVPHRILGGVVLGGGGLARGAGGSAPCRAGGDAAGLTAPAAEFPLDAESCWAPGNAPGGGEALAAVRPHASEGRQRLTCPVRINPDGAAVGTGHPGLQEAPRAPAPLLAAGLSPQCAVR